MHICSHPMLFRFTTLLFALLMVGAATRTATAEKRAARGGELVFRDAGEEAGLFPGLSGVHGHAAGWGDVDGNGWPDLYVGTFHSEGPPNRLLLNEKGSFKLADQPEAEISTRATGTLLADLDNDGDLDLYVASMPKTGEKAISRYGHELRGCSLFRNDGAGNFTDISAGNGACPDAFGGRSACVLDFDGDGLLDLLVGEDPLPGYNGSETHSSRIFRNLGDLQFADVSREVGLPAGIPGLGVAAADVNNDTWPDFFLASHAGGNRLFLNNGRGKFIEAPGSREVFDWPTAKGDDMVCGVCFGDVNRDGLLDVVLGQHFKRPWLTPVANRLYLNRGVKQGVPRFEDVTEKVGLVPLPMKGPHVEIQDFDNDGWPEIYTSIVKFAQGRPHPVIFQHQGLSKTGLPQFRATGLEANEFPTAEDKAVKGTGEFFNKMIADGKIIYAAPGPTADYDRDGRLDIFLANWWVESPSLLLRNETEAGNWLQVRVKGDGKVNAMGIGARVNVYPAGKLGDQAALLCSREIAKGYGYASSQQAMAHIGLGEADACDIEVILPHNQGRITKRNVAANQLLKLEK